MHFVHCFLPVAEGWPGEPRSASSRRVSSSSELDLPPGDPCEAGLLQLDVSLLRAQLRGSRLLDAMRMYRQGETSSLPAKLWSSSPELAPSCPAAVQSRGWLEVSFLLEVLLTIPSPTCGFITFYCGTPLPCSS